MRQKLRFEHHEDKRLLKTRAVENVLVSCNNNYSQEGQIAAALMEEVKRSKSNKSSNQKIPVYPNGRSNSLRPARSNVSLTPIPHSGSQQPSAAGLVPTASSALNSALAQGIITQQIGTQASELMKIQQMQQKYQSVSPHRPDAASYQQGKLVKSNSFQSVYPKFIMVTFLLGTQSWRSRSSAPQASFRSGTKWPTKSRSSASKNNRRRGRKSSRFNRNLSRRRSTRKSRSPTRKLRLSSDCRSGSRSENSSAKLSFKTIESA